MTYQISCTAAQRINGKWTITSVYHFRGGESVFVVDENGHRLMSVIASSQFNDFHGSHSTAGVSWRHLAYLITINGVEYFVILSSWGERIVIDLDHLLVSDSKALESELLSFERQLVMYSLEQLVIKANPDYIAKSRHSLHRYRPGFEQSHDTFDEDETKTFCFFGPIAPFAAVLECYDAVPLLYELEQAQESNGSLSSMEMKYEYTGKIGIHNAFWQLKNHPDFGKFVTDDGELDTRWADDAFLDFLNDFPGKRVSES